MPGLSCTVCTAIQHTQRGGDVCSRLFMVTLLQLRACSSDFSVGFSGLQEYVEAVSFQHFIKARSLISVEEINRQLTFTTEDSGADGNTVRIENCIWFASVLYTTAQRLVHTTGFLKPRLLGLLREAVASERGAHHTEAGV